LFPCNTFAGYFYFNVWHGFDFYAKAAFRQP